MIGVLRNSTYARLFSAQIVALLGTGLLTVALGLLAFDIAGQDAGVVLGTALTIKMVAYVAVSPVMAAMATRWRRKAVLVSADAVRAAVALSLPWVSEAWQIYVLIFALQAASATFTPVFQAVIPDVLPDEAQYTRALSLSRLAYDTESLLSPVLAAALLAIMSYNNLFLGTVLGFLASGALVLVTEIPDGARSEAASFRERLTRGVRVMLRTAELRSLLVMNLVVATSTAMVIVKTVVVVRGSLDRSESDVALLLAAFGAGSMLVALVVPRVLDKIADRPVMLAGSAVIPVALAASAPVMDLPPGGGAVDIAARTVGSSRGRDVADFDPVSPPASACLRPRFPTRSLCRTVLPVPRLLHAHLPDRRRSWRDARSTSDRADPLGPRSSRGLRCLRSLDTTRRVSRAHCQSAPHGARQGCDLVRNGCTAAELTGSRRR